MVASRPLQWLDPDDAEAPFPTVDQALRDPDGLLAAGGDLSPARLLKAYRQGIFPWYSEGQSILWWSPDPRAVLYPDRLVISRSLRKSLRQNIYTVTADTAFREVMLNCAQSRRDHIGTWITAEMIEAYCTLHELGHAHSIESWHEGNLAGGLYGVSMGKVFFGESMFSRRSNASKIAFVHLVRQLKAWGYGIVDCQIESAHLRSLGAGTIPRRNFIALLNRWCDLPGQTAPWHLSPPNQADPA